MTETQIIGLCNLNVKIVTSKMLPNHLGLHPPDYYSFKTKKNKSLI